MTRELSVQLHEKATYNLTERSQFGYCISEFWHLNYNVLITHRPIIEVQHTEHLSSVADPHHLVADPDPAFHFDADPDPDHAFHSDADADPDHTFQFHADPDPTTHFFPDLDP